MKKKSKDPKNKWVQVRMTETQYETLTALFRQSIYHHLSQYLRRILLQKEVTFKYRNESADEVLSVLIRIKNELSIVGKDLNQAVHDLHKLERIVEFRNWITLHQNLPQTILKKLEEIHAELGDIYRQKLTS